MSRLWRVSFVVLAATALVVGGAEAQQSNWRGGGRTDLSRRPLPDILVIVADDISWRDIDPSVPTPNIDALAAEGVSFRRAYSMPYCSPTRFSILFGTQPFREELGWYIDPANLNDVTVPLSRLALPRLLGTIGYETLAAGKWHLSTFAIGFPLTWEWPRMFGFDAFRAGRIGNLGPTYFDWDRVDDGILTHTTEYNTTAVRRATTEWWEATRRRPRFAYVAFHAAHEPYHDPPAELLPDGYFIGFSNRRKFEAMVVAMDTEIGNILATVDLERTLVIFLGDNGTPPDARAQGQDSSKLKGSVYEGGINVPFIVAGWGTRRNRTSQALISTTDIFATIADVLGLPVPPGQAVDSVSFAPQLRDPDLPGRAWVYSQKFAPNGSGPFDCNAKAVVTSRYKLMVENGRSYVFDLQNDPEEENPLKIQHQDRLIYGPLRDYMDSMVAQGAP